MGPLPPPKPPPKGKALAKRTNEGKAKRSEESFTSSELAPSPPRAPCCVGGANGDGDEVSKTKEAAPISATVAGRRAEAETEGTACLAVTEGEKEEEEDEERGEATPFMRRQLAVNSLRAKESLAVSAPSPRSDAAAAGAPPTAMVAEVFDKSCSISRLREG